MVGHRAMPGQGGATIGGICPNVNKDLLFWRWLYQSDPALWGEGGGECVSGIYGHLCLQFLQQYFDMKNPVA